VTDVGGPSPPAAGPGDGGAGRGAVPWAAPPPRQIPALSARRAYIEITLVFGAIFGAAIGEAAASLSGGTGVESRLGWSVAGPGAFSELATAGVAVALVILVVRNRGLTTSDIGWRAPRAMRSGTASAYLAGLRLAAWGGLSLLLGSIVTSALESGTNNLHIRGGADLVLGLAASVNAGFLEETVALAFVVTTLEQARRPVPEIYLVAVLLRSTYHIYYGPGTVGIMIWATGFVWLYRRSRSLWPLIALHIYWDLTSFMGQFNRAAGAGLLLVLVGVFLAAPITWLGERNRIRPRRATSRYIV
jgi:membrane protease YdiL (CAAX protease family)